ncbi:hypothetical protein T05_6939 [Trichinella murrelli]|uniref:FLYWCH-type domain-containing protein n=1 Tax=Trichinella murrelli TaxID=144512 RepID=A0A0V0UEV3_9BILA|nr:hypothetical protein T05_6939 [Trichinella murrelli]
MTQLTELDKSTGTVQKLFNGCKMFVSTQRNLQKLVYRGRCYTLKQTNRNDKCWICASGTRGCTGKLCTNLDATQVIRTGEHAEGCRVDAHAFYHQQQLNELKRLVAGHPRPVFEVFYELASNASTSLATAAHFTTWEQARNTMYYSRWKRYPRLPLYILYLFNEQKMDAEMDSIITNTGVNEKYTMKQELCASCLLLLMESDEIQFVSTQRNQQKLVYRGRCYTLKQTNRNDKYWICASGTRGFPGKLYTNLDATQVMRTGEHAEGCRVDAHAFYHQQQLNELKRLVAGDPRPVFEIYDELASNASTSLETAAHFPKWDQAQNTMYYSRSKG